MDSLRMDTSRSTVASVICDRLDQGRSIMSRPRRIPKEDLRRKITMLMYLCLAISDAMMSNDAAFGNHHQASGEAVQLLESPLVVLINSKSVAVGCGWQAFMAYVNVGYYYFVGLPIGCLLGFKFDLGAKVEKAKMRLDKWNDIVTQPLLKDSIDAGEAAGNGASH